MGWLVSIKDVVKFRKKFQAQNETVLEQEALIGEASRFIKEIEKGNLQIDVSEKLTQNDLGLSLLSMQKHLSRIAEEEEARNWMNAGLAKFADILRNKESMDLQELSNHILMHLVKYVNANQGGIFILQEEEHENDYLEMVACYAYNRKKFLNKRVEIGEGLVGQCFLEQEAIYLTDVPKEYIRITSGLGEANPRAILITPLLINEKIFGVIELASFEEFKPYKIEFISRLAENIASSIKNVKDTAKTIFLLNESQQQAEEMRAQEEEMRQNMEELQAIQEEMMRASEDIARASIETDGILKGINATMATIEFTPEGFVLNANNKFLKAMNYSLEDIKGNHHRKFVPKEIQETEEYKFFWTKLASGKSASGIFKRIDAQGNIVWLNAIYNPILNAAGEVSKVVKFATDITAEQEMLSENRGILDAVNSTMATIEFTPEGEVISANANFLTLMKTQLSEIKGKHHRTFVSSEIQETEDYKTFWINLAAGIPSSGIFERVDSKGETVWLNAIYNPILNASGKVTKVLKFATDVTFEKIKKL